MPAASRRRAFTLVELLVVLAVIAVLIALLFPALRRARRQALVLASPIAYVGADRQVHLTDPTGTTDLLAVSVTFRCPYCHGVPTWSPSGQSLVIQSDSAGAARGSVFVDPPSGRLRTHPTGGQFLSWADSGRYVTADVVLRVVDVETGRQVQQVSMATTLDVMLLSPAPPNAPGPYIGVGSRGGGPVLQFYRNDFSPGPRVWGPDGDLIESYPRIDAMGDFVAWSAKGRGVAIKSLRSAPDQPPDYLKPPQFQVMYFCDWTEQGDLLCNATSDGKNYRLVIFDRSGRLVRRLDSVATLKGPAVASWRKYGHR